MFSHVMIGTNDLEKAKAFYDALLGTLDIRPARVDGHRIFYFTKTGVFSVSKPINGEPATHANGGTIGFAANSPEQADAWHAAGIANGGKTVRESARRARGFCGQTLSRLFARSRRQQDLRDAPDAIVRAGRRVGKAQRAHHSRQRSRIDGGHASLLPHPTH